MAATNFFAASCPVPRLCSREIPLYTSCVLYNTFHHKLHIAVISLRLHFSKSNPRSLPRMLTFGGTRTFAIRSRGAHVAAIMRGVIMSIVQIGPLHAYRETGKYHRERECAASLLSSCSKERLLSSSPTSGSCHHDTARDCHWPWSSGSLEHRTRETAGSDGSGHVVLASNVVDDGVGDVVDESCRKSDGRRGAMSAFVAWIFPHKPADSILIAPTHQ